MSGHFNFSYEQERNTQLAKKKKEVSALMDDEVPMYLIVLFGGGKAYPIYLFPAHYPQGDMTKSETNWLSLKVWIAR